MLTVSGISKSFGGRTLFEDVSFQVNRGDRVALVGPNGAGKTTLFSLLLGQTEPDDGGISMQRGVTLGYLPQESEPAGDETVLQIATTGLGDAEHWHEGEVTPTPHGLPKFQNTGPADGALTQLLAKSRRNSARQAPTFAVGSGPTLRRTARQAAIVEEPAANAKRAMSRSQTPNNKSCSGPRDQAPVNKTPEDRTAAGEFEESSIADELLTACPKRSSSWSTSRSH